MHLMHFEVVNNNNTSDKTEGRLRSFDLAAAIVFLLEILMAGPGWVFPGVSASQRDCPQEATGMGCRNVNQICSEHP